MEKVFGWRGKFPISTCPGMGICMRIIMNLALGLCLFFFLTSCSSWSYQNEKQLETLQTEVEALNTQLEALKGEVGELRLRHDEELRDLRTDLKHVLQYLNVSLENLSRSKSETEESLKDSVQKTAEESLQKLLELSKKLLDKLETDLEKGLGSEEGKSAP